MPCFARDKRWPLERLLRCSFDPGPTGEDAAKTPHEAWERSPCPTTGPTVSTSNASRERAVPLIADTFPTQTADCIAAGFWYSRVGRGNKSHSVNAGVLFRLLGNDTRRPLCPSSSSHCEPCLGAAASTSFVSSVVPLSPKWFSVLLPLPKIKLSHCHCLAPSPRGCCQHHALPPSPIPSQGLRSAAGCFSVCFSWHEFNELNAMFLIWTRARMRSKKEARSTALENEAVCRMGRGWRPFPTRQASCWGPWEEVHLPAFRCGQHHSLCC